MGNKLLKLRNEFKYSLTEVSNFVKMDRTTIYKAETGERNLSVSSAKVLSEFYNVSLDYLLGNSDFGICCHFDDQQIYISEEEWERFQDGIFISNSKRFITPSFVIQLNEKRMQNNSNIVETTLDVFNDELNKELLILLLSLNTDQKKSIITLLKTFK